MDSNAILDMILGGTSPASVPLTPKPNSRSKDIPNSTYDKVKKQGLNNDPSTEPGLTGTADNSGDLTEEILSLILGANEMTPELRMTQKGEPAKNQNMMTEAIKKLRVLSDADIAAFLAAGGGGEE